MYEYEYMDMYWTDSRLWLKGFDDHVTSTHRQQLD